MRSDNTMMSARTSLTTLLTVLCGIFLPLQPALHAAPAREALVIGDATYNTLPQLPACLLSAHSVTSALRGLGFDVVEREDASSGGTDGAIGEFAKRLAAAPGAAAFVYTCTYATAFNDRAFLLPASANIVRPADVLTQGVLAKSLLDVVARGGAGAAVVAMDVVPAPGSTATTGLDTLAQGSLPDALGIIAASQVKPQDAPTPLAAALVASLKPPAVQVGPLLAAVQQQLGASKAVTLAALRLPATSGDLAGAPPPPPPTVPATAKASAPTPAPASTPAPAQITAPAANGAPSPTAFPADEQMTEADRRRVQTVLARLGYYDGQVDGIFGSDTRAAIRRYQHELGAAMTGRLTSAQATKLAGGQ
jgi:hypothetical protein